MCLPLASYVTARARARYKFLNHVPFKFDHIFGEESSTVDLCVCCVCWKGGGEGCPHERVPATSFVRAR